MSRGRSATALFILCAAPTVASYSTGIRTKGLLVGRKRRAAKTCKYGKEGQEGQGQKERKKKERGMEKERRCDS